MGQAKLRGTKSERVTQAVLRRAAEEEVQRRIREAKEEAYRLLMQPLLEDGKRGRG